MKFREKKSATDKDTRIIPKFIMHHLCNILQTLRNCVLDEMQTVRSPFLRTWILNEIFILDLINKFHDDL